MIEHIFSIKIIYSLKGIHFKHGLLCDFCLHIVFLVLYITLQDWRIKRKKGCDHRNHQRRKSTNMSLQNIGYKFDRAAKQWLAAFIIAASQTAIANANISEKPGHHYELLNAEQIGEREEEALTAGNEADYTELNLAREAIEETEAGLRATPHDLPNDFKEHLFVENEGDLYKVIDPAKDLNWTEYYLAQKTAEVKAEKVLPGTVVETILADGHVETTKTAGEKGGYRVTNPTGEQYLVDTDKFENLYDETDTAGIYQPKPDPRKVLDSDKNVTFRASWGENMLMRKGSAIVHGGQDDIYGIAAEEYAATYSRIDPAP